jgi:hypothetical protein
MGHPAQIRAPDRLLAGTCWRNGGRGGEKKHPKIGQNRPKIGGPDLRRSDVRDAPTPSHADFRIEKMAAKRAELLRLVISRGRFSPGIGAVPEWPF